MTVVNYMRTRRKSDVQTYDAGYSGVATASGNSTTRYVRKVATKKVTTDRYPTGFALQQKLLREMTLKERKKSSLARLDYGGPFLSESTEYAERPCHYSKEYQFNPTTRYYAHSLPCYGYGTLDVKSNDLMWPTLPTWDETALYPYGAAAVKAVAPVQPSVSLSTFIGELREAIPKLAYKLGTVRDVADTGSSNYLAYQFGVKPLVSDVKNISNTAKNLKNLLRALQEQNHHLLHRQFDFGWEVSKVLESTDLNYPSYPAPATYVAAPTGTRTKSLSTAKHVWFKGAFSYWIPQVEGELSRLVDYLEILGAAPNVDTFWNLLPFSWLTDWFLNTGDVLQNLAYFHSNNQIMNYGYLMQETRLTRTVEWASSVGTTVEEFSSIRKARIKASPFGFGLNFDGLTDHQLAILAALGIQRTV